jgi:hypothetical protein
MTACRSRSHPAASRRLAGTRTSPPRKKSWRCRTALRSLRAWRPAASPEPHGSSGGSAHGCSNWRPTWGNSSADCLAQAIAKVASLPREHLRPGACSRSPLPSSVPVNVVGEDYPQPSRTLAGTTRNLSLIRRGIHRPMAYTDWPLSSRSSGRRRPSSRGHGRLTPTRIDEHVW